jgi:hypothetical protein
MLRLLKILSSVLILTVLLVTLYINKSLYYQPEFVVVDSLEINQDLVRQLRFLKEEIHTGTGDEMQSIYPEGYLFMNLLYGLAWCDVAEELNERGALYGEAREEITRAYAAVNGPKGKSTFDEPLSIPYGAFYTGWNNYLLGKKLMIEREGEHDSTEVALFEWQCQRIAETIQSDTGPYPESYRQQAWPCDVVICVASLALHDQFTDPLYEDVIKTWIDEIQTTKDALGLLPHSVHYDSGQPAQSSRGCSQSLMLNFLLEIDPVFARQQFEIYKAQFLDYRFGLPGIREYEKGKSGSGDIDSGPIILNIGGAATIVGLRTMTAFKEYEVAAGIRNTIEALALPTRTEDQKRYLLGKLPIADAFIAWAHGKEAVARNKIVAHQDWRATFQLYSLAIILAGVLLIYYTWKD